MPTPVVFRRWPNGDVVALFPSVPADAEGRHCMAYEHVGQHSAATYSIVVRRTKLALPLEYAELAKELQSIGHRVTVRSRAGKLDHSNRRRLAGR